jgi:hypothetical protein
MFWDKNYRLCDSKEYAFNVLGRDKKCVTATITATTRIENLGHRLYMNNFSLLICLMIYYEGHKLLWYCQTKSKYNA